MVWRINYRRCTLSQVLARAMLVSDKLRLGLLAAWNRVGGSGRAERRRAQAQERASSKQASKQAARETETHGCCCLNQATSQPASQPITNSPTLLTCCSSGSSRSRHGPRHGRCSVNLRAATATRTHALSHTLHQPARVCGDEHQDPDSYIISHAVSVCGDLIHNGESAPPRQRTISLGKAVLPLLLERHRYRHRHW